MPNSQELSLDENAVFLPVDESSTGFLHSEREREAVEELLSAGAEAFYSTIGPERFGCFLSPEEVGQMSNWVQNWVQPEEENGLERNTLAEEYCSTYFPEPFDFPAPNLDLGWPEDQPCGKNSLMVYSSPPVEGQPPVREIIRTHLQEAKKVIAIVTDGLTDNTIISDLHMAASRGVPVYIILNKRSAQENFTLSRLRHPYMRVRVLGGKSFYSRTGRKVVGELKEKFLLVDLKTVILGSYSLTWTDAHLHRQLITVLTGSTVDWFDTEFRTLYADSLPVHETVTLPGNMVFHAPDKLKNSIHPRFQKRLSVELEIPPNIPSPAKDLLLDWKDMGFYQEIPSSQDTLPDLHENNLGEEISQQNDNKEEFILERIAYHGHHFKDEKRVQQNISPKTVGVTKDHATLTNTEPRFTQTVDPKRLERLDHKIEKALCRQTHKQKNNLHNGSTEPDDEASETYKETRLILRRHSGVWMRNTTITPSRRSLILDEPKPECHRYTNDILKTIMQGTEGILRRKNDPLFLEKPQLDLGGVYTDMSCSKIGGQMPRTQGGFFTDQMTPASILIKERNQETRVVTPKATRLTRAFDERKDFYSLRGDE
ncbi:protein FAM83E [Oryzias melastigma]|uniref:Family with sequence similarity 83 member E n=1 Tax=Oryzias melastigma TaxID=30732 RepID=A0A3B3CQP1_ORYME|nr:protein FAM83E [Oryzias melastigma]